jgi:hypothetical protein
VLGYVSKIGGGRYGSCTIHLNSRQQWNWNKLWYATIHETGHALGYQHTAPSASIMSPRFPNPVWGTQHPACKFTNDPPAPAPGPGSDL